MGRGRSRQWELLYLDFEYNARIDGFGSAAFCVWRNFLSLSRRKSETE